MADKKTILEEALLDIKNIQNALNANTKEILRSVAREEIDSVVKESLLKEDDFEEEDLEPNDGSVDLGGEADAASSDISTDELGGLDDIEGSEEVAPEMEPELGMDADALGGEEMDMTAASDDDVIAIYKKLSGEDEIEIVGDEIHLNISEPGEYVLKTNGAPKGGVSNAPIDVDSLSPMGDDDMSTDDMSVDAGEEGGVDYEIEMGDEDADADAEPIPAGFVPVDDEEGEEEVEEIDETKYVGGRVAKVATSHTNAKLQTESISKKLVSETKKKYNTLLTEAKKLKGENEEFRKALKVFRSQLVETVVFNSNLTYTTRLFMEHSTTKAEKQNIIKRFDSEVSNLVESKKLYKAIANELENRKPINESVDRKIIKEVTTGASKQLNESTAYVDPSTARIMDLIKRVEGPKFQ